MHIENITLSGLARNHCRNELFPKNKAAIDDIFYLLSTNTQKHWDRATSEPDDLFFVMSSRILRSLSANLVFSRLQSSGLVDHCVDDCRLLVAYR